MLTGMSQFYLQRPRNFATELANVQYSREHLTGGRIYVPVQVCRQAETGKAGLVIILHFEVYNQVPPCHRAARNLVKSHQNDRFMQPSLTAIRQVRDELVEVSPLSILVPVFEGTIYGIRVNLDTVKYVENVINATLNASSHREPDINYFLSNGLKLSNCFPWTHESIGIPIYVYYNQTCQYDGGTITNLPTSQYPELINLSDYQLLFRDRIIEEK